MTGSLNKQTIAKRALVSQMLLQPIRRIQQYSLLKEETSFSFMEHSCQLRVSTKGLTHSVDIELTYLKDAFIPTNEGLFWEVLGFLKECLYKPLSRVAQYQNKVFDIEKQKFNDLPGC